MASYDGPLGIVLRNAKYTGQMPLMYALGRFMAAVAKEELSNEYDGIIHVPTGRFRKLKRGFDQAEILAICLSNATKIKRYTSLRRIDPSEQSKRLIKERRNSRNRFKGVELYKNRILLVDDVCTTGNTLQQCAQELLCNGIKEVHTLSLLSCQI